MSDAFAIACANCAAGRRATWEAMRFSFSDHITLYCSNCKAPYPKKWSALEGATTPAQISVPPSDDLGRPVEP